MDHPHHDEVGPTDHEQHPPEASQFKKSSSIHTQMQPATSVAPPASEQHQGSELHVQPNDDHPKHTRRSWWPSRIFGSRSQSSTANHRNVPSQKPQPSKSTVGSTGSHPETSAVAGRASHTGSVPAPTNPTAMQSSSLISQTAATHSSSTSAKVKQPQQQQQQHDTVVSSADIHSHPSTSDPSAMLSKIGKSVQLSPPSGNITPTSSPHSAIAMQSSSHVSQPAAIHRSSASIQLQQPHPQPPQLSPHHDGILSTATASHPVASNTSSAPGRQVQPNVSANHVSTLNVDLQHPVHDVKSTGHPIVHHVDPASGQLIVAHSAATPSASPKVSANHVSTLNVNLQHPVHDVNSTGHPIVHHVDPSSGQLIATHSAATPSASLVAAIAAAGPGKTILPNGDTYEGAYLHGKRNGYGVYRFATGAVYKGNWLDNRKHGTGVYYYTDRSRYEGNWENDQRVGIGKYFYYNGDIYEGQWSNHFRHGPGIYTYGDTGIKWQGSWYNGVRIVATPNSQAAAFDMAQKVAQRQQSHLNNTEHSNSHNLVHATESGIANHDGHHQHQLPQHRMIQPQQHLLPTDAGQQGDKSRSPSRAALPTASRTVTVVDHPTSVMILPPVGSSTASHASSSTSHQQLAPPITGHTTSQPSVASVGHVHLVQTPVPHATGISGTESATAAATSLRSSASHASQASQLSQVDRLATSSRSTSGPTTSGNSQHTGQSQTLLSNAKQNQSHESGIHNVQSPPH